MFNWFSFFTYAVITAATPGPNNIMSMSNGARKGFKAALPFNLGIWTRLFRSYAFVHGPVPAAGDADTQDKAAHAAAGGGLYAVPGLGDFPQQRGHPGEPGRGGLCLRAAFAVCQRQDLHIRNNAIRISILPVYQGRALPLAGFALLLAFIGFLFTLCWSAFGSLFKLIFSRHAKLVNTIMALLLVYCAVSLFM